MVNDNAKRVSGIYTRNRREYGIGADSKLIFGLLWLHPNNLHNGILKRSMSLYRIHRHKKSLPGISQRVTTAPWQHTLRERLNPTTENIRQLRTKVKDKRRERQEIMDYLVLGIIVFLGDMIGHLVIRAIDRKCEK